MPPIMSPLLASLASWCLLAMTASAEPKLGTLYVDLVFPRNETLAPASRMPIVFALRNPEVSAILNPSITFDVWSSKTNNTVNFGDAWSLRWANFSGHPSDEAFFYYQGFTHYSVEDHWTINWRFEYDSYIDHREFFMGPSTVSNSTGGRLEFTTSRHAAAELDLVAALQGDPCTKFDEDRVLTGGVAINVVGAMDAPEDSFPDAGDLSGLVEAAKDAPVLGACPVSINAASATSIAARVTANTCLETNKPLSCLAVPSSGAQRLQVGAVTCLAAALGGLTYFMRFL